MTQPCTDQIRLFLQEDIGTGDITASIIPDTIKASASVTTRENMVLCGQAWFDSVFKILNANITIKWLKREGSYCQKNTLLCELKGSAKDLLTGERTALNILQTLSATATIAKQYADAVSGTHCKVLDTRKTIPGLRNAQKYAVSCGGCFNHRTGLYDGVLIKENHIIAAGSIALAVSAARKISNVIVEVEVESLNEYQQAILANPDRIMLDNFSLADMKTAVSLNDTNIELEASGDISLKNIREIAETGVDFISIGALTKHIQAINLSLRMTME
ncbi:MAG: carboxylating nicotinate-nucleotide diphosphorylase [Methylococcales symbiont of Iophon sp. n. MRB-2018]|nr:MAG: carboxylating nicotinate-nucleotide diphosphorylase [Methylococcales symbiont of Iophon sp. n. MRB-2018]KAF3979983.1 MAG: carboxylating nicotinate-nucleotide diphosphorylase [Methylococcales symbiont of Iophon sp. n. MRB-2018]